MMRTIKAKLNVWKMAVYSLIVGAFFFIVSCNDQKSQGVVMTSQNQSVVPQNILDRFDQLKKEKPGSAFVLLELDRNAQAKIDALKETHGIPCSVEVFELDDELYKTTGNASTEFKSQGGILFGLSEYGWGKSVTFGILEYNEHAFEFRDNRLALKDTVTVRPARPLGGFESLGVFLEKHIQYPDALKKTASEGSVDVAFVVNTDGRLSDFKIVKSAHALMDEEALRVVRLLPKWEPAIKNGKSISTRWVFPIKFKIT